MWEAGKTQEWGCSSSSQVQDAPGPLFPFPKSKKMELQLWKLVRDVSVLFNYLFFSLSSRMAGLSLLRLLWNSRGMDVFI